jgi:hypothetical protein
MIDGFYVTGQFGEHINLAAADARLPAISLATRMSALRHPEVHPLLVEIQENKLCIYPTEDKPQYFDLRQAEKILPKLTEFIKKERGE